MVLVVIHHAVHTEEQEVSTLWQAQSRNMLISPLWWSVPAHARALQLRHFKLLA
jgi:hypothetical protein